MKKFFATLFAVSMLSAVGFAGEIENKDEGRNPMKLLILLLAKADTAMKIIL